MNRDLKCKWLTFQSLMRKCEIQFNRQRISKWISQELRIPHILRSLVILFVSLSAKDHQVSSLILTKGCMITKISIPKIIFLFQTYFWNRNLFDKPTQFFYFWNKFLFQKLIWKRNHKLKFSTLFLASLAKHQ